ncbi:MAG: lytic transglycosylase domain-containing protein, partial [Marmoricola sp.]
TPLDPASVTVPEAVDPVVVSNANTTNTRGWSGSQESSSDQLLDEVLAAYTLAIAVSPTTCRITTPMLAAIGQVESGNLAGYQIDAAHRVVPEILGPVLDGKKFRAVPDTDDGTWDGDQVWDRALGPMQIIPASWRVVGLDLDGDGVRDPQNVYDSAGAAMVYLCSGGRDLSTDAGLRSAVLSYNRSDAYLEAVLAWKAVYDEADLNGTGAVPFIAALGVPLTTPVEMGPPPAIRTAQPTTAPTTTVGRPVASAVVGASTPIPSASPSKPSSPAASPSPQPSPQPTPEPAPEPAPEPTPEPAPEPSAEPTPAPTPAPTPDPTPDPDPEPTVLPCPLPTEPTDPAAEPAPIVVTHEDGTTTVTYPDGETVLCLLPPVDPTAPAGQAGTTPTP